jgi:hypothetical protein
MHYLKKLEYGKQLCKYTVLSCITRSGSNKVSQGYNNGHSTGLESSALVFDAEEHVDPTSLVYSKQQEHVSRDGRTSGALSEPEVDYVCLEKLKAEAGWSDISMARLTYCLAPSTMQSYNKAINRFNIFCRLHKLVFPQPSTGPVADFLCEIALSSERPKSVLRTASAAIGH